MKAFLEAYLLNPRGSRLSRLLSGVLECFVGLSGLLFFITAARDPREIIMFLLVLAVLCLGVGDLASLYHPRLARRLKLAALLNLGVTALAVLISLVIYIVTGS